MRKRKRLNLGIKKEIQLWILKRIFLILILSISAGLFILYYFSHKEITSSFYQAHFTIRYVSDLLIPIMIASGSLCLITGIIFAIFFPQKIAGPIYRLEKDLEEVAQGNFQKKFRLRRDDQFHSLAGAINKALERIRSEFFFIENALEELEDSLKTGDKEQALRILSNLRKRLQKGNNPNSTKTSS